MDCEQLEITNLELSTNNRLIKDDGSKVNLLEGKAISYTGILYKNIDDIRFEIKTDFIGIIEAHKWNIHQGDIGIYVKPEYIRINNNDYRKIINYTPPTNIKYFFYNNFNYWYL